jgi:hypothetical protein
MASNTQIVLEIIVLVVVMVVLWKQVKTLFLKEINGYTIHKVNSLFEVRKGKKVFAQFVYERSAIEYCNTH